MLLLILYLHYLFKENLIIFEKLMGKIISSKEC